MLQSVDTLVQERGHEPDGDPAGGLAVQGTLAQIVLEGRGLDAAAKAIGLAVDGGVLILDAARRPIARYDPSGALVDEVATGLGRGLAGGGARARIVEHHLLPGGAYARPVPAARGGRAQGWLLIATEDGRIDQSLRLVVAQAATVVGLELGRRGVATETERRLTAGLVGDAIAGRTGGEELGRRLAAFGIENEVAVAVFTAAGVEAERGLQEMFGASDLPAAVSTQEVEGRELICAIVEVGEREPGEVAEEARRRLVEDATADVRAGVSRARPATELPRTFQEAHWALGAAAGKVGSWRDLGVESLLLSVGDPDVLHLYCDRLLGPVLAGDSVYAGELLHSLELFILHNGQWERAARELHCHRHTLRYRMRKVEELTGRDLSRATDRIEFWLALRARELSHRAR